MPNFIWSNIGNHIEWYGDGTFIVGSGKPWKIVVDFLNPPPEVLLISKRPSKFSCKHRSCGHPSTLPFPPLLLEIYQALDDWSDLELNGETRILHWRNTGCKKWLCTKFARGNYVKEQRTTILTLCPVSPGFPGAPGTPGKPLELTKSKSQVLLAIIIIQYSHTKSAR